MKYIIRAHANLRHYLPDRGETVEISTEERKISDILLIIGIPDSEIMQVKVGSAIVSKEFIVGDFDTIELFPIMAGG